MGLLLGIAMSSSQYHHSKSSLLTFSTILRIVTMSNSQRLGPKIKKMSRLPTIFCRSQRLGGPLVPALSMAAISPAVNGSSTKGMNKLNISNRRWERTDIRHSKIFTKTVLARTCSAEGEVRTKNGRAWDVMTYVTMMAPLVRTQAMMI